MSAVVTAKQKAQESAGKERRAGGGRDVERESKRERLPLSLHKR